MSSFMLAAALAVPDAEEFSLDYAAGRAVIESVSDKNDFGFTEDNTDFEFELDEYIENGEDIYDDATRLVIFRRAALGIIDELEELGLGTPEESSEVSYVFINGCKIFIAGGLSSGDAPSDATEVMWRAYKLPTSVLSAIGFVTK